MSPTKAGIRYARQRAGRFNLWAIVFILALASVFWVKAQTVDHQDLPSRYFAHETAHWARDSKAETNP